jgi:hypothetical protein
MFGSVIIEVAIGIIFVFILVSIICTTIREGIESKLKSRAAYLEHGIRELLHDRKAEGLARSFFTHPLINGLFSSDYKPGEDTDRPSLFAKGGNLPSYIPSKNFAMALMDIAARGPATDVVSSDANSPVISVESIRANILNIQNMAVQRVLLTAIDSAQGDLDRLQQNIEAWFNNSMDRVSGWYKRSTQWIILVIALIVTVGLNINTITIADYLYHNNTARSIMVAKAEAAAKDSNFVTQSSEDMKAELAALDLPIGWGQQWSMIRSVDGSEKDGPWNTIFVPILGWLLTALAATMGAPFWFDMLNKIMVLRSTVKPVAKGPDGLPESKQNPVFIIQPSPAPPNLPQQRIVSAPNVSDEESGVDGCDVTISNPTSDTNLPPSEGGIA